MQLDFILYNIIKYYVTIKPVHYYNIILFINKLDIKKILKNNSIIYFILSIKYTYKMEKNFMPNIFILLSHKLTQEQIDALKNELKINNIILLPENLQLLWGNIPPEPEKIHDILNPIRLWLKENAKSGDYALIQGDMGATYQMINYAFSINIHPCYTTTERISLQEKDNNGTVNVIKQFKHIRFRLYEK